MAAYGHALLLNDEAAPHLSGGGPFRIAGQTVVSAAADVRLLSA